MASCIVAGSFSSLGSMFQAAILATWVRAPWNVSSPYLVDINLPLFDLAEVRWGSSSLGSCCSGKIWGVHRLWVAQFWFFRCGFSYWWMPWDTWKLLED